MGSLDRLMFMLSDLGTGGTARATLLVVNGLAEMGVEVSLVVMRGGGVLTPLLAPRVKLIVPRKHASRGGGMLFAVPELARIIRAEQPTMIVSSGNHMHVTSMLAHRLAGVRGCGITLKLTNVIERPDKGKFSNGIRRGWYNWAFGRADRVLTLAESARDELVRRDARLTTKLRVVDNPYVTNAMISAGAKRRGFEPGRLLAIGRLVPQKNYALLLDALARISHLDWTLDILGDGPLLGALERQAVLLGIGRRVNFRGFVADPVPFLQEAHAYVLSSAWEGLPAVLLEALACGCPVIATRSTDAVGAILGEGSYGRLTAPGDAQALADAIAAELSERSCLSDSTASWVARYHIEAGVSSHARALSTALAE